MLAAALLVMAAMLALAPLMGLLWLLLAVVFVLGLAEGVVDVGGNALLVWVHRERVGPFLNAMHFCFGAGALLAPLVIAQAVLLTGDITWGYWVLAGLLVLPALWLGFFCSSAFSLSHARS